MIISILLLLGLFSVPVPVVAQTLPTPPPTIVPIKPVERTLEQKVKDAFNDPRMLAIANCESRMRQYSTGTNPLISPTSDVGVMQINQVHWKRAKILKLDIFHSEDDNIKMGKIIYDSAGITSWMSYQNPCYYKYLARKA